MKTTTLSLSGAKEKNTGKINETGANKIYLRLFSK